MFAAEQKRPAIARFRARWKAYQGRIDPRRLVFLDETWIKTNMAPLRGWGPRCKRLLAYAPYKRWKTMTFIAALRHDRIEAPWVLDGPINGEAFEVYMETQLLATLKSGDIVVADNLGSHKNKAVRKLIRDAGARLFFLPADSPDLNPIEQVFAKTKHLMRKAMARTVEAALEHLAKILETVTPKECSNYLQNSGYAAT